MSERTSTGGNVTADHARATRSEVDWLDIVTPLAECWRSLLLAPLAAGIAAYGGSYLISPTFVSSAVFLPPQQQQSTAAAAIASQLGGIASLGGAAGVIKSPGDQFVSMLESATISDRIIDQFKLRTIYEAKYIEDARKALSKHVDISVGKKDSLITIAVEDEDRGRAAEIANRYVDELRRLTATIALTEAQVRRAFYERQLEATKVKLASAEAALQVSGISGGTLKSEPRTAVESFARLDAQLTVARVKLQTLKNSMNEGSFEVEQQEALIRALESQKATIEQNTAPTQGDVNYVNRYRDFKYQEALFELYARQFEAARADESREGSVVQVIDPAKPAERRHKPKRSVLTVLAAISTFGIYAGILIGRSRWRASLADPATARKVERLRHALARK